MSRLDRLLRPQSLAVIGGGWSRAVIARARAFGFPGPIHAVHPTRAEIDGVPAVPSVADLPHPPDAVFVGVNRVTTIETVRALREIGAGGAVIFAAGFKETGAGDLQDLLFEAAGDMPIVGPNCYGLINALDRSVIWPDEHGLTPVDRGVAILSQSSNIAISLGMQNRGLPIGFVGCIGNAAQTGLAELGHGLIEDDRVTALGLYIEGFGDGRAFADMVAAARAKGKGVVVLKAGRTEAGRAAAVTHTAALTGSAEISSALLRQSGAGEVESLPQLIETLKILHHHGPLVSDRVVSVSCSGGEAGLMADAGARAGVTFPPLPETATARLSAVLGPLVGLANPLDYNTFIWNDEAKMTEVFSAATEGADAGLYVIDPPREPLCSRETFLAAIRSIINARKVTGKPIFAVSTMPDTYDDWLTGEFLSGSVVPLLGMDDAFAAIRAAATPAPREGWRPDPPAPDRTATTLTEAEAKTLLAAHGIAVPRATTAATPGALDTTGLTAPFALKGLGLAHKSEAGAVRLNVTDPASEPPMEGVSGYLLEEMVTGAVAELLVDIARDPVCGAVLTLGWGGTKTEVYADTSTLIPPVTPDEIVAALKRLRLWPLLDGFRGAPKADLAAITGTVMKLQADFAADPTLIEIEINPLMVRDAGAVAADALIRKETP